jgi:hypothetical protein
VDSPAIKFRSFISDASSKSGKAGTDLESWIVAKGEAEGESRPELPSGRLRNGSQHLKLATVQTKSSEVIRKESLEIISPSYDDCISSPLVIAGDEPVGLDHAYRRVEAETYPVFVTQIFRGLTNDQARINGQLS